MEDYYKIKDEQKAKEEAKYPSEIRNYSDKWDRKSAISVTELIQSRAADAKQALAALFFLFGGGKAVA